MSGSEGPKKPSEVAVEQSDKSGGGGLLGKFPDVSLGDVEIPWKGVLKRFGNTEPEVDIESLTEQHGYRRAHALAFVRKFLGKDGMPALAHLVLALMGSNKP